MCFTCIEYKYLKAMTVTTFTANKSNSAAIYYCLTFGQLF